MSLKKLFLYLLVSASLPSVIIEATGAEEFPQPACLNAQVKFWETIYYKYSVYQYVLHDDEYLDIVYKVLDFYPDSKGNAPSWKQQQNTIRAEKSEVIKKLELLAADPEYKKGNAEFDRYRAMFADKPGKYKYTNAQERIRAQAGLKERFKEGLETSGMYMSHMKEIMKKYNVPEELAFLPHVESSFKVSAYSKCGAAGIWQFTRSTGRLYLTINYNVDERRDPISSSEAAAKLLAHNYAELKSWPLAITAYNSGLTGMKRAVNTLGSKDICEVVERYESKIFKFASRNFYTEFLAARNIASNPTQYFPSISFEEPLRFYKFTVTSYLDFATLISKMNLNAAEVKRLNPHLRPPVLNGEKRIPKGTVLWIPDKTKDEFINKYEELPQTAKHDDQIPSEWHKVRRGDSLSTIAKRYGTTISKLCELNAIRNAHAIRIGQRIKLPGTMTEEAEPKSPPKKETPIAKEKPEVVPTPAGSATEDTQTTGAQPTEAVPPEELPPPIKAEDSFGVITVVAEETLYQYAEWSELSVPELVKLNKLPKSGAINIGRELKIPLTKVTLDKFAERREEYHEGIRSDFYTNYKIDGTTQHTVKRKQTIWSISEKVYKVPMWLVEKYNPEKDLGSLKPGDTIVIPVVVERTETNAVQEDIEQESNDDDDSRI